MSLFYETPDWIALPVFVILFVAASLGVVLVLRPFIRRQVGEPEQWNRVLVYISGAFGVFFGILLALVVVAVYENYAETHAAALNESSQVRALYRGTNGLPEQLGDDLRRSLRDYVATVIEVEWPDQASGRIPTAGGEQIDAIENQLYGFDPETLQDQAKFSQALATFDDLVEARRVRIDATTLQLPGQLWLVIWVGAAINAVLIGLVYLEDRRLHLLLAGLLAVFVAMVIFITADMDHPYAGSISVGPGDFVEVLNVIGE